MKLVLAIPAELPRRELDDGRSLVVLAGTVEKPVATLTLRHPTILPMSLIEFASDFPRSELPEGAQAEMQSARVDRNQHGWEMQVVQTGLSRPGDRDYFEYRLTAIYCFTSYHPFVAGALARILDPARLEELRPQIVPILQSGRPDWSGPEPTALAQFYD